jgi:hypothetical protein
VYPYAVKVAMWGRPIPIKTSPQGTAFLREHLEGLIPRCVPLVAYSGYLHGQETIESLGVDEEAMIVVPMME